MGVKRFGAFPEIYGFYHITRKALAPPTKAFVMILKRTFRSCPFKAMAMESFSVFQGRCLIFPTFHLKKSFFRNTKNIFQIYISCVCDDFETVPSRWLIFSHIPRRKIRKKERFCLCLVETRSVRSGKWRKPDDQRRQRKQIANVNMLPMWTDYQKCISFLGRMRYYDLCPGQDRQMLLPWGLPR